jgi:hypothetical protein
MAQLEPDDSYWCLVAMYNPVRDIRASYTEFINRSYLYTTSQKDQYNLAYLGYISIASRSMKSKVFGALFASI